MKYTAVYKNKKCGDLRHMIQTDYKTKADFKADVKRNGLILIAILTDKEIELIKNGEYDIFKRTNLDYEYVRQCID